MVLRSLLLTALLTTTALNGFAQNRTLILKPGDSIGKKIMLPRKGMEYISDYVYNIPAAPSTVVSGLPVTCNLLDAAQQSVNRFQRAHLYNGYVDLGRDFLDGGYVWTHDADFDGASWRMTTRKDSIMKSKLMTTLFSNKMVQEAVYQWLLPAYLDAYSLMSVPEQKAYIRMFRNGIAFADTFNIETQKRIADNSENYGYEIGSLNAFIYRRVYNKQLTRQDCIQWMNRILTELENNQNQNPQPADELVLTSQLGYGYYSATDYADANGYGAEFNILKSKDEGFEILPIPQFQYGNYDAPESNFFTCFSYKEEYTNYIFYCDSSGYSFTKTPFNKGMRSYAFMGTGMSARVLIVYYYEFEYPDPECEYANLTMASVVDLDSGYIVHDSVGIVECNTYDEGDYKHTYYPALNSSRIIFYCHTTNGYGVMDRLGNILLPPKYKSIEFTPDSDIVKVNGKKLVSVFGGGKPPKKKK